MSAWLRSVINRCRRALWRALFFRIVFGERSAQGQVLPHTRIAPSTCIEGERQLRLADHVFIGQFNFLDAHGGLTIGEGVQITNFVSIVTHSSHRSLRLLGRAYAAQQGPAPGYVLGPVEIGPYSFIGPHSLIEANTRIGRGVVVCAYAQVRGEVPDFAIVAGQPARVIGDVRHGDARLLAQHPWLAAHYQAWAKELPEVHKP
ncbi:acyltransferase [Paucibacter soli]|uniref:acyltransferase n=1 Tax=Paucibacter soli TaxID=3133433 RepID=UPI0030B26564